MKRNKQATLDRLEELRENLPQEDFEKVVIIARQLNLID
jgi:hypothetical protein